MSIQKRDAKNIYADNLNEKIALYQGQKFSTKIILINVNCDRNIESF